MYFTHPELIQSLGSHSLTMDPGPIDTAVSSSLSTKDIARPVLVFALVLTGICAGSTTASSKLQPLQLYLHFSSPSLTKSSFSHWSLRLFPRQQHLDSLKLRVSLLWSLLVLASAPSLLHLQTRCSPSPFLYHHRRCIE